MDTTTLPVGDRGITTLIAKRKALLIPTLDRQHGMVIPASWDFWIHDGVFYSREGADVFATDRGGVVHELDPDHTWTKGT